MWIKVSYTVPENKKDNGEICGFDDIKNNDFFSL